MSIEKLGTSFLNSLFSKTKTVAVKLNEAIDSLNAATDGTETFATVTVTGAITSSSTTDATSKDTGAIVTEGGIGVEKAIFAGTNVTATTAVITNTITERTTNSGVTVDGALIKDGSFSQGGDKYAGLIIAAAGQDISGPGVVQTTQFYTAITTTGVNDAFTLAAGTIFGQLKKVKLVSDGGDAIITGSFSGSSTTLTLNDAGDYALLMWYNTNWIVVENFGCTLA